MVVYNVQHGHRNGSLKKATRDLIFYIVGFPKLDFIHNAKICYCLFRAFKLIKNANPGKYGLRGYGIGLDAHSLF